MASRQPDLGSAPVSAAQPAGANPRDGENFGLLQAEIDKLTNLNTGSIDWHRVADLASGILANEGKDVSAAVWLTSAWLHTDGVAGLTDGVQVLRGLHEQYWDEMSPPPARLRARRNQMGWLLDDIEKVLADLDTLAPITADQHTALLANWDALDAIWQARDTDAPALYRVRRLLAGVPQESTAPAPASETPASPVATSAPERAAPVTAAALPTITLTAPPSDLGSTSALEDSVERVLDALQPLLTAGVEQWPGLPWLYSLTRVRAWGTLDRLPPAQGDATFVPAPNAQERDALARVLAAGDAATIVAHAESRLPLHRFWLDLNRASHAALQRLPDAGAAAAIVATDTARLLARFPDLATLRFNDGQPFADDDTRAWLARLNPAGDARATTFAAPAGSAFDGAVRTPTDALALATAIAAASAQTEAAGALLAGALERLQTTARQIAATVTP